MNTLYALIIACLSLQVWFGPSAKPTTSINVSEYSTARELGFEGASDANAQWAALPRLEDYSIETGFGIDDDGHTAAVTVPAPKIEDQSIDTGVDIFADDDAWDFTVPAKTDPHGIQASDWW
jgi:hypothetical protein